MNFQEDNNSLVLESKCLTTVILKPATGYDSVPLQYTSQSHMHVPEEKDSVAYHTEIIRMLQLGFKIQSTTIHNTLTQRNSHIH
jgi:hypothetical protein